MGPPTKFLFLIQLGVAVVIAAGKNGTDDDDWVPYLTPQEIASVKGSRIDSINSSLPLSDPQVSKSSRAFGQSLWTNAQVPYTLDRSLTEDNRREFAKAIQEYHDNTCIRFIPKQDSHRSWVNIENDPNTCGVAHMCMNNGQQWAKFGGGCATAGVMIHELGHTLCMGHEQTRRDRDEWISWDTSKCQPHGKDGESMTGGLNKLYDYVSVEHYEGECYSGCIIPKVPGVTKCGSGGTLSVLDIEILNEMYGCKSGCQGLRWANHETTGPNVITGKDWDGVNLFSCRAYHEGDIIPGKYRTDQKACWIPYGGGEQKKTGKYIEIFTDPNGGNLRWMKSSSPPRNAVKGGRGRERETIYLVQCILNIDGNSYTIPGKFHNGYAYASLWQREHWCKDDFYFLLCG